jgi:prepilin signal peptidase PulO-like enzyme (type II secretory pathway)
MSFLVASLILVVLMPLKIIKMGQQVPFGPFIAAGTWLALLFGVDILNWYLDFIT